MTDTAVPVLRSSRSIAWARRRASWSRGWAIFRKQRSGMAVAEPAFDGGLQRPIAHAVRQQKHGPAGRASVLQYRLQAGEEAHHVEAGLACQSLVAPIVAPRQRQIQQSPQ